MNIGEVEKFVDKYKEHCRRTYEVIEGCNECELDKVCFQLQRVQRQLEKIDKQDKK